MNDTVRPRCYEATDLESARQALARVLPVAENDLPWRALGYVHAQLGSTPAFAHSVGAALIVAELRVGADAVAAALLHACLGDTADFDTTFGTAARLARGVAAMARIETLAASATDKRVDPHAQLEALRQMVLAMVEDIRVVLVKLAERTHALRCAASQDAATREALGQQARELFAPLANRLGVWQIKWEMEDWAFRYLEPDTYKTIATQLDEKRADREAYIKGIIERLQAELALHGIEAEVSGRPKHIASIVNKMRRKRLSFEQLYDIRAVRVLVKHEIDCYTVLGLVHNLWQPIPGEFDDYISQPKSNDYRSLHTAVIGPEDRALEVQIRTFDMHRHAELGVAAHWRYKEGGRQDALYEEKIAWLRRILEWKDDVADSNEFTEQFKTELFQDQVYVLTPQGRVVALDRGATPVDFAYALHTDLGHRCRGAKVNGAMVPLNTVLDNGQRVEIVTVKEGEPSRDWLNPALGYLVTHRARSKVRTWFRQRDVGEQVSLGRSLLEKELKRLGVGDTNQEKLAQRLQVRQGGGVPGCARSRRCRPARSGQCLAGAGQAFAGADAHRQTACARPIGQSRYDSWPGRRAADAGPLLQAAAARRHCRLHHGRARTDRASSRLRLAQACQSCPHAAGGMGARRKCRLRGGYPPQGLRPARPAA